MHIIENLTKSALNKNAVAMKTKMRDLRLHFSISADKPDASWRSKTTLLIVYEV